MIRKNKKAREIKQVDDNWETKLQHNNRLRKKKK